MIAGRPAQTSRLSAMAAPALKTALPLTTISGRKPAAVPMVASVMPPSMATSGSMPAASASRRSRYLAAERRVGRAAAPAGIDGEQRHHVDHMENRLQDVDRRRRVERHGAQHAAAGPSDRVDVEQDERPVQMQQPLGMDVHDVGAGLQDRRDDGERIGHYQVDVLKHRRAGGGDQRQAGGEAGTEHAVHDVEMQQGGAGRLRSAMAAP